MYWMYSHITIGDFVFENQVNSVKIESSRKQFGDKATITLGNLQGRLEKEIAYGAEVIIKLGYDGELHEEFKGYVSSVSPKIPLTIECEDEMYQLKRQEIQPKSWRSVKLNDLINYIAPGALINVYDITLSPFRIDNTVKSRAEALQKIKDEFGLDVYFRDKKLFVGIPYSEKMGAVYHSFHRKLSNGTYTANAMMESLVYKQKSEVKILVKAISIDAENDKIEAEVGDKGGETHTLHFYNLTKPELIKAAEGKIDSLKYDGYRGQFKAFGKPLVKHGMVDKIDDAKYPERAGNYFVDSVETSYNGSDGFKRLIELGRKSA